MTDGFMGNSGQSKDANAGLDDAAQAEQEYVRKRLREELKREPTEEELNEWLRQHTEGY
jgi:DNA-directed RNA polymerase specialized sigma subunit